MLDHATCATGLGWDMVRESVHAPRALSASGGCALQWLEIRHSV